ncbi:MAG TPA: hypothetical protein VFA91_06695 [Candidatus Polarisedimenticolia bacterium]|nr:hypothetical protein [Candidatus Polarisedimenticolia bacterium]
MPISGQLAGDPAKIRQSLRRIFLVFFILGFAILAAFAVFVFEKHPRIDYSATNRTADLVYLATWMTILAAGALACLWRRGLPIAFTVFLLLLAEACAQAYVYKTTGGVYQPEAPPWEQKFEPHPLLVGIPRPGNFAGLVHDADHRRRTDNPNKAANARVIFIFGSSTAYDLANNDLQTWASDLSRRLGPGFTVQNLAVPGYSSAENLIQSLFVFRDSPPACAIYFAGSDLRNSHIAGLKADYSDFDLPSERHNLGLAYPGFLVNNLVFLRSLIHLVSPETDSAQGTVSSDVDPHLMAIFSQNMRLIGAVNREFGVRAIFIPVVANWPLIEGSHNRGWFPLVEDKDIKRLTLAMSVELKKAAEESGASYIGTSLELNWTKADFTDSAHFNQAGAEKFADSIADDVAAICR